MENTKTRETLIMVIWAQALVATLGSLFFSEIMGYVPCELCWIQRILMYPLVIIYGTALIKKDLNIALPGLILSGIGMLVSIYHYFIQKLPALQDAGDACGVVPCNTEYVNYFGFVTIPFLASTAFIIIFVLHLLLLKRGRK
ncbi:disulfide bond formation protein DsbB [Lentibacillus halodurans]|uniref:Probable disulfide formation protein n=1 Tax=Lentibacillus halodurans TaxID=237679 RepID=A0A1I0VZ55_9BACI|nr:disulfide oxidoreductase [Lentibacillus halodurans]SFA81662.1 disulfide bond formation protein DsbB [Lentibacillus halodurans]